jgi:hypothetical protein
MARTKIAGIMVLGCLQVARNLLDTGDGFLTGMRFLLSSRRRNHDDNGPGCDDLWD